MKISAMGKKSVILGLAIFLILSSFHEVSSQASYRSEDLKTSIEDQSTESESSSEETSSMFQSETLEESSNVEASSSIQSNKVSGGEEKDQSMSTSEEIDRLLEAHLSGLNTQDESEGAMKVSETKKIGESKEAFGIDSSKDERLEKVKEIERQIEAMAASKTAEKEETTNKKSSYQESSYQESSHQESSQKESSHRESSHQESSHQESSNQERSRQENFGWKNNNGGSGIAESLGLGQSGAWRCINENKNGEKEEDSIVIPKYELDDIIKEESIVQGSSSKTSSLISSLTQIVEKHKKGKWSSNVSIGKVVSKEKTEIVEKLKVTLKSYRNMKISELVTRTDFEEILTMAARYEELSSASVSYISRLSMYRSVIQEKKKASQRVQLAQKRVKLLKEMAMEKQTRVDSELELVKTVAKEGDKLSVKIFAMKRLISKLEAEKKEVDVKFQKVVENFSSLLEEASQAYEEYLVVVRKWKEEEAAAQFSIEALESAEHVWVQFLGTL